MKKIVVMTYLLCLSLLGLSQSFTVGGDFDKFYPVLFSDANWSVGATELEITRSSVHTNSTWRGSLISKFRFHTSRWGHGSNFMDANIRCKVRPFIADWRDATGNNNTTNWVIWLRGGTTTYNYKSNNANIPVPVIYDGEKNALPFQEQNGSTFSLKVDVHPYINQNGLTLNHEAYFNGGGKHFIGGKLEIGFESDSQEKLLVKGNASVTGTITATEIKVEAQTADFVFEPSYALRPLKELEAFVKENKHLPEIPSAKQMEEDGVNVAEMNKLLLQKIEELTLYTIEQERKIEEQNQKLEELDDFKSEISAIKELLKLDLIKNN